MLPRPLPAIDGERHRQSPPAKQPEQIEAGELFIAPPKVGDYGVELLLLDAM